MQITALTIIGAIYALCFFPVLGITIYNRSTGTLRVNVTGIMVIDAFIQLFTAWFLSPMIFWKILRK